MSLSIPTASSKYLVKLVQRYGSVPAVSNIFLILGAVFSKLHCDLVVFVFLVFFYQNCYTNWEDSKQLRLGIAVYITLMYHLAASSHLVDGGADPFGTIYYRMSGRQKSKKKSAARCFLAHVFIFLMKCSSSMSDYYQDESEILKTADIFIYF